MIAKSITIIRENFTLYLVFIAVFSVLIGIQDAGYLQSGGSAGTAIVWLIIARYIHRNVLFGRKFFEPNPDGSVDNKFMGFAFKGLLLGLVAIALAVPFLFVGGAPTADGGFSGLVYLALIVASILSTSLVLALAGSWLPADVYGQNKSLGAALKRGMSTFVPVFIRILGITLLGIAIPVALVVAFSSAGLSASTVVDGRFNVSGAVLVVLMQAVQCFCVTFTAVVLCHYYLAYEGKMGAQPQALG